jgi:prepilin peptidase CpaA
VIWEWVSLVGLVAVLVVAAVCDLARGKVFNWLTYPAIVVGLALGAAQGAADTGAWDGFLDHVLGFGFGFGILFIPYLLGGMGGGDVKLMGVVGAFLGWENEGALHAVFYSFLVAAAVGVILMIWRGETRRVLRRLWLAVRILPLPKTTMNDAVPADTFRVPFGFAVCVGTLWFLTEDLMGASLWDGAGRLLGL